MAKPNRKKHLKIAPIIEELQHMLPESYGLVENWHADVWLRRSSLQIVCGGHAPNGIYESAAELDLYWLSDADPNYTARHTMLLAFEAWVRELDQRSKKLLAPPKGLDDFIARCWAVVEEKRREVQPV